MRFKSQSGTSDEPRAAPEASREEGGAGAPGHHTKKAQKSRVSPGLYQLRHRGTRLRGGSEHLDCVCRARKRLSSATETQRRANFRGAEAGGSEPCLPGAAATSAGESGTNGRLGPTTLSWNGPRRPGKTLRRLGLKEEALQSPASATTSREHRGHREAKLQ